MKKIFIALAVVASTSAVVAAAPVSGQYVCKSSDHGTPEETQAALNSLNCDNTKPISVTPFICWDNGCSSGMVCCVTR